MVFSRAIHTKSQAIIRIVSLAPDEGITDSTAEEDTGMAHSKYA